MWVAKCKHTDASHQLHCCWLYMGAIYATYQLSSHRKFQSYLNRLIYICPTEMQQMIVLSNYISMPKGLDSGISQLYLPKIKAIPLLSLRIPNAYMHGNMIIMYPH